MAERPILLLPEAAIASRAKRHGGGVGPEKLGAERQQARLGPRLQELERAFESKRVLLQSAASDVVPEDVLVLETAGTVEEFVKAVRKIGGFEFLAEYDEQDIPPDDDFFTEKDGTRTSYTGRVYIVFANQEAFKQLQRLWKSFQDGIAFQRGQTKWRDVFAHLRDIRPWSVQDRLDETGVLDDWSERVQQGDETVYIEIELWFRTDDQKRKAAAQAVRRRVEEFDGTVLNEGVVRAINYHGLSVRLPIAAVRQVLNAKTRGSVRLVQCEEVQFFRPSGQMAVRGAGVRTASTIDYGGGLPSGAARVALLDGLPLQNHHALVNRLIVDDPDSLETNYRVDARFHGTAMASVIIWGDLNEPKHKPIPQLLYVRPIMQAVLPQPDTSWEPYERVPEGSLVVDLVHRAVRRLYVSEGNAEPAARDVALVNFSIGDRGRQFAGTLSPLAKLLDWLSWQHKVLFVVSAGNHTGNLNTGTPWSELHSLNPDDLTAVILRALAKDTRNRRALSPAEAMNALTVGAIHQDSDPSIPTRVDPVLPGYPSPLSAHGLGYRRSIKPDILVAGGRLQFDRPLTDGETNLRPLSVNVAPGVQVAAPGSLAGDVTHTTKSRGTSNAAAMLTRNGAFLASALEELREGAGAAALAAVSDGVVIKTLLAHGASWGDLGQALHRHFGAIKNHDKRKEQITRLLGFGRLNVDDVTECSPTRVTAIGAGEIAKDEGAEHRFPLPPSLSGKRGLRRLRVTLAWFTPVNPLSHRWRQAQLWFETPQSKLVVNRVGPDWQAVQRGTLQHEVLEEEAAAVFVDGDDIVVRVSCREDAPGLQGKVPYALAVTLEVADSIGIDIYSEVRERVRQRLRV